MKKLEEYETPETDIFVEMHGIPDEDIDCAAHCLMKYLERRLAMCRDALRDISDTVTKGATLARETLKATEPK